MRKINTAFISSTSDLSQYRSRVLDTLLKVDIFPFCMENFTVDAIDGFQQIEELIADSDFFILLLGPRYGTRDENSAEQLSYTEKEYRYAIENRKKNQTAIVIFILEEIDTIAKGKRLKNEELQKRFPNDNIKDIRSQIKLIQDIKAKGLMPKVIGSPAEIPQILQEFISNNWNTVGWYRGISLEHVGIQPHKKYYHVHLMEDNADYLRFGTMEFSIQKSSGLINVQAENYQVNINSTTGKLETSEQHRSEWRGEYYLKDNNGLTGIYTAVRHTSEKTNGQIIESGNRNGIHTFRINQNAEKLYLLSGTSQDAWPVNNKSQGYKSCSIFVFEDEEKRLNFLQQEYGELLNEFKERKLEQKRKAECGGATKYA